MILIQKLELNKKITNGKITLDPKPIGKAIQIYRKTKTEEINATMIEIRKRLTNGEDCAIVYI